LDVGGRRGQGGQRRLRLTGGQPGNGRAQLVEEAADARHRQLADVDAQRVEQRTEVEDGNGVDLEGAGRGGDGGRRPGAEVGIDRLGREQAAGQGDVGQLGGETGPGAGVVEGRGQRAGQDLARGE